MPRLSLDQKFQRLGRISLGERLDAALALTIPRAPIWDLCCDHGLLGANALVVGGSPYAILVDRLPGVIADLRARLRRTQPEFYLSRFFVMACPAEALPYRTIHGTIFVLGVGEATTIRVLEALRPRIDWQRSRLVVIPEKKGGQVGRYMEQTEFPIWPASNTKVRKGYDRQIFVAGACDSPDTRLTHRMV